MAFHWRDGWCFSGDKDGNVRIQKVYSSGEGTNHYEQDITIPAAEWASIIAHVSADPNQYANAEAFHANKERA